MGASSAPCGWWVGGGWWMGWWCVCGSGQKTQNSIRRIIGNLTHTGEGDCWLACSYLSLTPGVMSTRESHNAPLFLSLFCCCSRAEAWAVNLYSLLSSLSIRITVTSTAVFLTQTQPPFPLSFFSFFFFNTKNSLPNMHNGWHKKSN